LIGPAPWHTRFARGEAFGGTDGEIRLQDRTYGTHVGKGGQSGDEWWADLDTLHLKRCWGKRKNMFSV